MKNLFIIANFKSNKTRTGMEQWMEVFDKEFEKKTLPGKTVVLAPSMPSLMFVSNRLLSHTSSFALSVQDISPFPPGSYTGAVSGENLEGFQVSYAIIGHSERRQHMHETETEIERKCERALSNDIIPILCVQGVGTPIPQGVQIVAYEPVSAIGTGNPDTPEHTNAVAKTLKERDNIQTIIYGGSVNTVNVHDFTSQEYIDGVLVGKACLDPQAFIDIIHHA